MVNELKKTVTATVIIVFILFATLAIGGLLNLLTPANEALFFAWVTSSIGFGCSTFAVIVLAYKETNKKYEVCSDCELKDQIIVKAIKDINTAKIEENVENVG